MSDSESDHDDPAPGTQVYTEDDIMLIGDDNQNEDNVNVVASPHIDVIPDSDEEEMRAGPSGTRSSQRVLSSDEDDDSDMTVNYHSSAEYH